MLVITRKPGQSFVIDPGNLDIEVTVLETHENDVRIGIKAPKDVDIMRSELLNKG